MNEITKIEKHAPATAHFDDKQIELIKNSICKGASNEELQFFLMACKQTGLDPFARQIYSVPRGGQRTIQTSVDGFRLIADRTGRYSPGREPTFEYDKHGCLISATSYVMKQTKDGTWHEVSANAHYNEYNAGSPLWKKMPRAMLSKCAECLALRKSFPAEMSGLYGQEEMDQADKPTIVINHPEPTISEEQAAELQKLLDGCSQLAKDGFLRVVKKNFNADKIGELPASQYEAQKETLTTRYKVNQDALLEKEMANDVRIFENE